MDPFEELYKKYQSDIYRFLLYLTGGDPLTAEELTQECFFQAFLSFRHFRGECSIKTWLCQIAKNVHSKYIRKESRQRQTAERISEMSEETASIVEKVVQNELIQALTSAMKKLDETSRNVVEYRMYYGMSYSEISKETGIRPETAAVMFSRAKQKLSKIIREEYGYEI